MSPKISGICYTIDIGNTRIHCGIVNTRSLECIIRIDFPAAELEQKIVSTIRELSNESGIPICTTAIMSGGNDLVFSKITKILKESEITALRFCHLKNMPFSIVYDNIPGADRIADALFCKISFPDRDHIIIGAGTAITVNVLFNNEFSGGVIFPGVTTQLKSLPANATALPLVNAEGSSPLPGHSTETCIRSGVLYGIAGAIQRIIAEYKSLFNTDFMICATGGDWPILSKFIDIQISYVKDMTLVGIALGSKYYPASTFMTL